MNVGVVYGTLHLAAASRSVKQVVQYGQAAASKVLPTLRVAAARGHLRRCRSSTMGQCIDCVAAPCI
jgi:hypothetical protein